MKTKLGWILFSIMTVAVIVLSSILVSYNVRWKSGEELLDLDIEDVESAYLFHNITAMAEPDRKEYDLTKEQIEYIIKEFRSTKFEITKENAGGGVSGVVFKLKDGSETSFSVVVNQITVNGKQYKCHSYLTAFILSYGFDK